MSRPPLPGELRDAALIDRILRVDQAGETGAVRIYQGQLAVLKSDSPAAQKIRAMADQEQQHLDRFDTLLGERRARPSLLGPLWNAAGFAMGAATALLGESAAMACTEAVEEVIQDHYAKQMNALPDHETGLKAEIAKFRDDEIHHRDDAIEAGARNAPLHGLLTQAIRAATRAAVWAAERV